LGLNTLKKEVFMLQTAFFSLIFLTFSLSQASKLPPIPLPGVIYQQGEKEISLKEALKNVRPGQTVVLGESHGTSVMAAQQVQVLETLREMGLSVSTGMEFFAYPFQNQVEAYLSGFLPEPEFLQQIEWGEGFSFDFYRQQVLFPKLGSEFVVALNAPRSLTGQIVKVGLEGLSEAEKALLPPQFSIGNEKYFERFKRVMSGPHMPTGEALNRYFVAQSTWDDTMAWKASQFLKAHPDQVLVIIVGEFHVQYGGGLPDRLKARGIVPTTFSLVNLQNLNDEEKINEVLPSETDGARADFVWTSQFSENP
jgi:uncharacterized iron-regulated protein